MITIKGKKDYLVALESVAMTDIVMNMFIFFFISFSLIYTFNPVKPSKIEVRLPKASTAVALEGSDRITLTVTRQGRYLINDEEVNGSGLRAVLEARLREDSNLNVVLKADGSAKFNSVVRALDVLNELKIEKVSMAATNPVLRDGSRR